MCVNIFFNSDLPPQAVEVAQISLKAPTGTIEFRDDVDVLEQVLIVTLIYLTRYVVLIAFFFI